MTTASVRLERRAGVAIVTLDRPDRMNSFDRSTVVAFGNIGREVTADDSLRAVIVTGAGDKAFCAGADLKERRTMDEAAVVAQLALYRSEFAWLETSAIPVIAAINGAALGGGLEIALMCDLRVAASHAILGLPETALAVIPGAGGTQRLPRLIGAARAKEMILLARRLTADEALAWGLVSRVTHEGRSVLEDTLEWITPIIEGAPIAQRAALEAIDAAAEASLAGGLDRELTLYRRCLASEDRVEALTAFAEKRRPSFKGR